VQVLAARGKESYYQNAFLLFLVFLLLFYYVIYTLPEAGWAGWTKNRAHIPFSAKNRFDGTALARENKACL